MHTAAAASLILHTKAKGMDGGGPGASCCAASLFCMGPVLWIYCPWKFQRPRPAPKFEVLHIRKVPLVDTLFFMDSKHLFGRLPPQGLTVTRYQLWLDLSTSPDLQGDSRHGKVILHGRLSNNKSGQVVVHLHRCPDLVHITQATCHGKPMTVTGMGTDARDVVTLCCSSLPGRTRRQAGDAIAIAITITFVWTINAAPCGLYRVHPGQGRPWYLASQLEPTAARKVFPCLDEPDKKARFCLFVKPPATEWLVLSNMPRAGPLPDPSGFIAFQPTPPMSTYLVAVLAAPPGMFVCTTEARTPITEGNTLVRVWSDPDLDAVDAGRQALDMALYSLRAMAHLTGVAYSLPKLDLVPVHVFDSGAMENWGLLTFRRERLLSLPAAAASASAAAAVIQETVAHEVAHQWFGNAVTMRWWHHLWLNESFATLCAAWICAHWSLRLPGFSERSWAWALDSDLAPWRHFLSRDLPPVLGARAVRTSRRAVVTSADIEAQFDGATYTKGAAVLRGLFLHLGTAAARVVRKYFVTALASPGSTAAPKVLWEAARQHACCRGREAVAAAKQALGWEGDVAVAVDLAWNAQFAWPTPVAWSPIHARTLAFTSDFGAAWSMVLGACRVVHSVGTTPEDQQHAQEAMEFLKRVATSETPFLDIQTLVRTRLDAWRVMCRHLGSGPSLLAQASDDDHRAAVKLMLDRKSKQQGKFALRGILRRIIALLEQDPTRSPVNMPAWRALLEPLKDSRLSSREIADFLHRLQMAHTVARAPCRFLAP